MDGTCLLLGLEKPFAPGLLADGPITMGQVVLLFAAVGILTLVMFGTRRRFKESKALGGQPARKRFALSQEQTLARNDLERVMLELDELSRQVHGRLDVKMARLEVLIRDADSRISRLNQVLQDNQSSQPQKGSPTQRVASQRPVDRADASPDSRYGAIYRLADQGKSVAEIARQVGQTAGEVELILGLRRARQRAEPAPSS